MEYNILSVFIVGILVGNFLDTFTALAMISLLIMVRNKPLPQFLGGTEPNTIIMNALMEAWLFMSRINQNKNNNNNDNTTSIKIEEVEEVEEVEEINEQHNKSGSTIQPNKLLEYQVQPNIFNPGSTAQPSKLLEHQVQPDIFAPENNKTSLKIKIKTPN